MKIKFCGIRRLEDVQFCNELQPDYLGMILSAGFRRTVSPETAKQLVNAKRSSIAAVGVFVNETPEQIAEVLKHVRWMSFSSTAVKRQRSFRACDGVPDSRFGKRFVCSVRQRLPLHSSWAPTG